MNKGEYVKPIAADDVQFFSHKGVSQKGWFFPVDIWRWGESTASTVGCPILKDKSWLDLYGMTSGLPMWDSHWFQKWRCQNESSKQGGFGPSCYHHRFSTHMWHQGVGQGTFAADHKQPTSIANFNVSNIAMQLLDYLVIWPEITYQLLSINSNM